MIAFFDPETTDAIRTISDHPHYGYCSFLRAMKEILLEESVCFKHEAFNVEKEWRVIVRQREFVKQTTDDGGKTPLAVHFRPSKGMLVPYVKLVPTDPPSPALPKKLPIQCIRTGPTLEQTTAAMAVTMMLEKNGYPPVQVYGSDIPVIL